MSDRRQLEQALLRSYSEDACPATDALAAYVLGDLSADEQLRLAAHLRSCTACQELTELCAPPAPRPALRTRIQSLVAQLAPLAPASGLRGADERTQPRTYFAADLVIALSVPPPEGEAWSLLGQVLRAERGLAQATITLRTARRRAHSATSDAEGFFAFRDLPTGRYLLMVNYEQIRVEIRDLTLSDDA